MKVSTIDNGNVEPEKYLTQKSGNEPGIYVDKCGNYWIVDRQGIVAGYFSPAKTKEINGFAQMEDDFNDFKYWQIKRLPANTSLVLSN